MVLGRIDIGSDTIYRAFVVGQKLDRVAAQVVEHAQVGRQAHARLILPINRRRGNLLQSSNALAHRLDQIDVLPAPLEAPAWQSWTPDQQIQQQPDPRQKKDEKQPALGRLGRAARRYDRQHYQPDRPVADDQQRGPEARSFYVGH